MKQTKYARCLAAVTAAVMVGGLAGCAAEPNRAEALFCADNEILSYEPVDFTKTVITMGQFTSGDVEAIETALEKQFPEIDIVTLDQASVSDFDYYAEHPEKAGDLPDIMFLPALRDRKGDVFYDLSAEDFVSRYHLSALNDLSAGGKLYQLPVSSSAIGIFYNKTLFEQHGWDVPSTIDDFYALCEEISAEGIRPFVPCFKYSVRDVGFGLSNREVFSTVEKKVQYDQFVNGEIGCKGLLEPYYEALKTLYDKGIVVDADFSSSLTQNRQALYAGSIAMLPERLDMYSLYKQEQPDCEIGFIGYPTQEPGERWMQFITGRSVALSREAMKDPEKKQILLDIFDYLSTNEGQDTLLQCFTGLSSLSSYQSNIKDVLPDIQSCIDTGRVFYADSFATDAHNPIVLEWMKGNLTMGEIIAQTDGFRALDQAAAQTLEIVGTASEDFTFLETGFFVADTMRQTTGADIALVLHRTYYKGNFARLYQGEITQPLRFTLRSLGGEDYLTTYEITGADLKKLMEHPMIGGEEINAMYAFSGLRMTYAPWNPQDENVQLLTLENGSAIDDDALYTVAAWATTIDESYIYATLQTFEEVGTNVDLMTAAIQTAGIVSPAKDQRITLKWG